MSFYQLLLIALLLTLTASLELGLHCDFVDLCSLGTRNDSTCAVGQKFLIRGVRGVRRQFLVSNSSSLVMFLTRGVKVTECSQMMDITSRLTCKEVPGLSEMVLAGRLMTSTESLNKRRARQKGKILKGRHCEFIRLCQLPQCQNGDKFLVQAEKGVRRQFLLTNEGKVAIFLTRGRKARDCSGPGWSILTDITPIVECKPVPGATILPGAEQESLVLEEPAPTLSPSPPVVCPCQPPYNNTWNPSYGRCTVNIASTHDSHSITCNGETTDIPCGGNIDANGDLYSHPLCSTNGYLAVGELIWQCTSLTSPSATSCP